MLPRNGLNKKFECMVRRVPEGTTLDRRKDAISVQGHIGDNAIIHSHGMPTYGSLGQNVTFYIYDGRGNCVQTRKLSTQGPMPVKASDSPFFNKVPSAQPETPSKPCVLL